VIDVPSKETTGVSFAAKGIGVSLASCHTTSVPTTRRAVGALRKQYAPYVFKLD